MIDGYSLIVEESVDPQFLSELNSLGISTIGLTPSLLGIIDVNSREQTLEQTIEFVKKADMEVAFIQGLTFGLNLKSQNFLEALVVRLEKISEINEFFPLKRVFVGAPDLRLNIDFWGKFLDLAKEYSSATLEFSFENICKAADSSLHHAPFGVDTLMYDFPLILDVANHLDCDQHFDHSWTDSHRFAYAHISHRGHNLPVGTEEANEVKSVLESFNFKGLSFIEVMHAFDLQNTSSAFKNLL
jgi:hypothetical protein